jgi:cell division protein FtsB
MTTRAAAHPQAAARVARPSGRRTRKRRAVRLTARAAILLALMLFVGSFAISPLRDYWEQGAQLTQLEHQATQLEEQNAAIQKRITNLRDPQYLQMLARECLGFVRPGQTAFVIVPAHGPSQPATC